VADGRNSGVRLRKTLVALATALLLALAGCGSDDNGNPGGGTTGKTEKEDPGYGY
jgi:hypothetical protein